MFRTLLLCFLSSAAALNVGAKHSSMPRRAALAAIPSLIMAPPLAVHAASAPPATEQQLLDELAVIRKSLDPLPALLDEEKWDSVRSVLKPPPVGNLWNLGESKNTLRKLADLRDDVSSPRPLSQL